MGLIFLFYFLLMGISGILLNHPSLIRQLSIPMTLVPESYVYSNWNRMAFREAVFSAKDHNTLYVGGKAGVWESRDSGKSFTQLENGFPVSPYNKDTRCLLLTDSGKPKSLYAGTRIGLYRYDFNQQRWQRADDGTLDNAEIVDLVRAGNRILVFTPFACFGLSMLEENPAL